jgi:hypothetical protein
MYFLNSHFVQKLQTGMYLIIGNKILRFGYTNKPANDIFKMDYVLTRLYISIFSAPLISVIGVKRKRDFFNLLENLPKNTKILINMALKI